ncbi:MAG: BadF/BadG/BcrA/BcrD ATPase family protein, partial [Candidatus Kryptoniota bacterium]
MTAQEQYFLGFDGGATKISAVTLNLEKEVVAEEVGKPANFQIMGIEQASINILEVTESILGKLNADFSQVKAMYLGLAGTGRKSDAEKMLNGFVNLLVVKKYPVPKIQVGSDAIAALEGAFGGKAGMIFIGGTGSILFAKEADGEMQRVGGWGRFIGDEGSGYALGRSCLTAIAKEFDGRGKKTNLTHLLGDKK